MNLYIIRHGVTVWNEKRRTQGRVHNKLSKRGIELSEAVARQLRDISFDYIFCSPLLRAVQTANIINKYHNKKIIKDERLTDIDQGYFTGKYFDKLTQEELIIKKSRAKSYGMESLVELFERVSNFFNFIKELYKKENILIVTHSGVAKFIEYVTKNNTFNTETFSKLKPYKNCEIKKFLIDN